MVARALFHSLLLEAQHLLPTPTSRFLRFHSQIKTPISCSHKNPVKPANTDHSSSESRYSLLLNSYGNSLSCGRQIHGQIITNGILKSGVLQSGILRMYVLSKSMVDATNVFSRLERTQTLPWNWMIRGFLMASQSQFSLLWFLKMLDFGVSPDKFSFMYAIKACSGLSAVGFVKYLSFLVNAYGYDKDLFVVSSLMKVYVENDCLEDARHMFDEMTRRDCVIWNVLIGGYVRSRNVSEVFRLFDEMRRSEVRLNSVTFVCVLSMFSAVTDLRGGMQIHGLVVRNGFDVDTAVLNTLMAMYSRCRCWLDAKKLLNMNLERDLVSWNAIISGFVQSGYDEGALDLFYEMQSAGVRGDCVTFSSILPSFANLFFVKQGKEVHAYIMRNSVEFDAVLKSALIDMYFKCREVNMAVKVFEKLGTVGVVDLSAVISGYVLNEMNMEALDMFRRLLQLNMIPNSMILASFLSALSALSALKLGQEIHGFILKNGLGGHSHVGSALMVMYAKCGRVDLGLHVFGQMSERDTICWNTIITTYSQNGLPEEAIKMVREMGVEGCAYDSVTISAALSACGAMSSIHYGKEMHRFVIKTALKSDVIAESSLVDMYAKCGDLVYARRVFDLMQEKNEVTWNSMISGYGVHGHLDDVILLFREMRRGEICPDLITFLTILSACSHAGRVDEGCYFFRCMIRDYGIKACMEHYACMVDMLGRAGRLDDALCIINEMPFEPDSSVWSALLGASRVYRHTDIAKHASECLFQLDASNSGYYVLLANAHAEAGGWAAAAKVRNLMERKGIPKLPGYSWIEINGCSNKFIAADTKHVNSASIYSMLYVLTLELKEQGCVAQNFHLFF